MAASPAAGCDGRLVVGCFLDVNIAKGDATATGGTDSWTLTSILSAFARKAGVFGTRVDGVRLGVRWAGSGGRTAEGETVSVATCGADS